MAGPPKPLVLGGAPTAAPAPQAPPAYAPPPVAPAPAAYAPPVPVAQVNNTLQQVSTRPSGGALTLAAISATGTAAQRGVADLSGKLANSVKTSDMEELGKLLSQTMLAAKGYDPATTKGRFFGMIKRKVEEIRLGYESAESTTNRLLAQIDARVAKHRQRDADIKQMVAANRQYHDQLGPEIEDLLAKVAWMEANVPAVDPADPMSAQRVQEWHMICAQGRKHADDLERSRVVSRQMDAQMQMLGQQGVMLVQKFDSFKTTTMPVLRQAFVMYIMALEQEASAKMSDSIDNLTDETLKTSAAKLGQTTSAVHSSLARSSISLDAIKAGHDAMLQSLDEIERIRTEMKARLASEAPQIQQMSQDLQARLARPPA